MKGRLPSKFQIASFFGSSFIVEGLWMCVCVCVCVCVYVCVSLCVCVCMRLTSAEFCFNGSHYKNRHDIFVQGGFWYLPSWL